MLTRTRQQLVEERTAIKNKIRMKFHQLGLIEYDENRPMSHKLVKELLSGADSSELRIVIQADWNIWKMLDEEICKLAQAIKEQAKTDPNDATYRSAPGVGPLSARILANELGDMSQFNNERQLFDYTGLTPCEYSSGENIRRGHISRQGNSRLRGILVESAWRAIEKDRALGEFFERPELGKSERLLPLLEN